MVDIVMLLDVAPRTLQTLLSLCLSAVVLQHTLPLLGLCSFLFLQQDFDRQSRLPFGIGTSAQQWETTYHSPSVLLGRSLIRCFFPQQIVLHFLWCCVVLMWSPKFYWLRPLSLGQESLCPYCLNGPHPQNLRILG